jgi:predicted fused transcriptional regulator/phosphomethylpyrimidine kinase/predicted transcriptional regulator
MKFIEEVVVEEFLPTVRSMLATELRDRGLTQHEVAEALGISQSAVSKYAQGGVDRTPAVAEHKRVRETVERIAEGLAAGNMSRVQALVELEVLIRELETGGLLATLHERHEQALGDRVGGFDVHDPEGPIRTAEQVRSSVQRGLRTLTTASGFAALIPAVGSNLVECLPDATGLDDVAGVPGRIFDVKGRATVPAEPEFGVSEHVAGILLAAREAGLPVRAAINVRYDPDTVSRLRDASLPTVEFDPEADRGATRASLRETLADRSFDDGPVVCYHTGGYGVEAVVYILGSDAPTIASLVRDHLC